MSQIVIRYVIYSQAYNITIITIILLYSLLDLKKKIRHLKKENKKEKVVAIGTVLSGGVNVNINDFSLSS